MITMLSSQNFRGVPTILFLSFFISPLKEVKTQAVGCKNLVWLLEKHDYYLHNHTIQIQTDTSESMCRIICYMTDSCLSHNFHKITGTCDINDSDEFQHPDDLIEKTGYIYRGTQNSCQSSPCPSNSTCKGNIRNLEGYRCLCPSGFTGPSCNTDINECTSENHKCPPHSSCVNTVGSFECRCEGGYHKRHGQDCIPGKGTKENPAKSCLNILKSGHSKGTGHYWLDPGPFSTGIPFKAFCDMTTNGGGWTKVKRIYLQKSAVPAHKVESDFKKAIGGHYNISANIIPSGQVMLDIHQVMGFHQIHFYCHKKSVGKIVSIMTKNNTAGQAVVDYFTNPKASIVFPTACGSFDKLHEDTSYLAYNCAIWGSDAAGDVNKWGDYYYRGGLRISTRPFHIKGLKKYAFACYKFDDTMKGGFCDDYNTDDASLSVNDTWQIAVR